MYLYALKVIVSALSVPIEVTLDVEGYRFNFQTSNYHLYLNLPIRRTTYV